MAYTGNIDADMTATLPEVVAESVAEHVLGHYQHPKVQELTKALYNRLQEVYKHNKTFGKKVEKYERSRIGARDFIYGFMEHWAKAYLVNPKILSRKGV